MRALGIELGSKLVRDSYGNDKITLTYIAMRHLVEDYYSAVNAGRMSVISLNDRTCSRTLPWARVGSRRAETVVVVEKGPAIRGE